MSGEEENNVTVTEVARFIDVSAVRTAHSLHDIMQIVQYAKRYRFINVHALPCWTQTLAVMLKDEADIYVGAPVGFPSGAHRTAVKVLEAECLLDDGVQEMDIVMNVSKFKNREYNYVLDELRAIVDLAKGRALTKVIIEVNVLTDYEVDKACEMVMMSGADFLKTGTGWVPGDINMERFRRIKELTRGSVKLKAAGGIRAREEFEALLAMGVERFGINIASALEIVRGYEQLGN